MDVSRTVTKRVNVLFLIDYLGGEYGGSERQLVEILRGLDRTRFKPALCCLWTRVQLGTTELPCSQMTLSKRPIRWVSTPSHLYKLYRLITAGRFDIVHTFFPTSNLLGPLAARLAAVPVIISSRRDLGYWQEWPYRFLLRALRGVPTCFLANCLKVKQHTAETEGVNRKRVAVVYNGVDTERFSRNLSQEVEFVRRRCKIPDQSLVVGVVANYYRPVKGVHYFVEAAKWVAEEIGNVRFVVVGYGGQSQYARLQDRIRQLRLEEHFIFTGLEKDIRPFLALFQVGVLPSLSEGFSNSLLEYMAAGLPSVASDVGGNKELISDGETGFLVKPASPQALADKITLLLKNPSLRQRMGENARRTVKSRFSIERMVRATESLYENLLRSSSSGKVTRSAQ